MTRKGTYLGVFALAVGFVGGSTGATARPELTGTGGGPETTVTAPYTASTGQTVPSGTMAIPTATPSERTEREKTLDRVLDGVCVGC